MTPEIPTPGTGSGSPHPSVRAAPRIEGSHPLLTKSQKRYLSYV